MGDEKEIGCHRIILSVRSNVFKAMFKPDKNKEDKIRISEFEGSTIRQMIKFIYTDQVDQNEDNVDFDLLAIAHKYEIRPLQAFCEEKLSEQLDKENVLDAWMSANLVGSETVLNSCEVFLKNNWESVKKTTAYSMQMRENKDKMIKLMASVVDVPKDGILHDLLNALKQTFS